MALKIKSKKSKTIFRIILFIALAAIIVQLYPHQNKFNYQYELGKPWTYGLLTATTDFPIYKSDNQLQKDKEEILKNFTPYFSMDNNVGNRQINKWYSNWKQEHNGEEPKFTLFINKRMKEVYDKGILSYKDFEELNSKNKNEITIVNQDRTTQTLAIQDIYTPKTAYEEIENNKPYNLSDEEFQKYNLNLYLVGNLTYDSITSYNVQQEMLKGLSLTSGMIQTGERIIDRGELVTPQVYAILNSMKIQVEKNSSKVSDSYLVIVGEVIMVAVLLLLLSLYLTLFRPLLFNNNKNILFIVILVLLMVSMASIATRFFNLSIYLVPFTLLPVIIRVFYDSRTALFVHIIVVLLVSFMANNPFLFIILQLAAGMAAVSGLKDLTQRSQLTQTAFYIFLTYVLIYLGVEFISVGDLGKISYMPLIYLLISSILLLFAYVLIYIFEKTFGLISSLTLVELTNINSDLMLKFAECAPGTFQHSLQMSNLAAEAAKKINANSLLVRTGALYHDIGKMKNPQYFIENQSGGVNPLLKMSYIDAAQAVIRHVPDGIEMAKKNHLPEQIIAFISTHHGRSKVKYFYNSFVNENPGVDPDMSKFTYPGPRPFSKETAILMMADAIEARSRTLDEYTEENITKMVDDTIDAQIADGQLKNAPISFRDVETVKKVMAEKIKSMYHNRIKYPELKSQPEEGEKEKQ